MKRKKRRIARLKKKPGIPRWIVFLIFAVVFFLLFKWHDSATKERELLLGAEGEVYSTTISKRYKQSRRRGVSHVIEYSYLVKHIRYHAKNYLLSDERDAKVGDPLLIVYLPSDPCVHKVVRSRKYQQELALQVASKGWEPFDLSTIKGSVKKAESCR